MRARKFLTAAVLLVVAVLACGGTALADQAAPVDPSVYTELDTGGNVPVIVYATPGHLADLTAELGAADVDDTLSLVGALSTQVTADTVDDLAALPFVDYVAADVPVFGTGYVDTLDVTNTAIGLGGLPAPADGGPTGAGVGVAVLDSGSADVPDLEGPDGRSRVVVPGRRLPPAAQPRAGSARREPRRARAAARRVRPASG